MTQSTRGYMKNTGRFFIYVQPPGSTIWCKARFLDGKMTTDQFPEEKKDLRGNLTQKLSNPNLFQDVLTLLKLEPVHYEKVKLKPPIPRMNSKTPSKTGDSVARQKSPPVDKKIMGGAKIEAEKK